MVTKQPRKMCLSLVSPCHSCILLLGKVVPLFVEITRDFVWEEPMSSQQPVFHVLICHIPKNNENSSKTGKHPTAVFKVSQLQCICHLRWLVLKDSIPQTSCYFCNTQLLLDVLDLFGHSHKVKTLFCHI